MHVEMGEQWWLLVLVVKRWWCGSMPGEWGGLSFNLPRRLVEGTAARRRHVWSRGKRERRRRRWWQVYTPWFVFTGVFTRRTDNDNAWSPGGHRNCVHLAIYREEKIRLGETRSIEESVKKKKKEKREASPRSEKIMEKQNTGSAMFIALVRDTLDKRNPS